MNIALITGSYPPQTCGIGDFTCKLENGLRSRGIHVDIITRQDWSLGRIRDILGQIRSTGPDLVHIQYPTVGFGWHVTPQMLSLAVPCVVTLHELSKAHVLRQLALYPFTVRSKHIIFTTPYERSYAARRAPWISGRSSVIPIGSNIMQGRRSVARRASEIVYFGLFRPGKGLEDVYKLAALIKQRKLPFSIRLVGKAYPADSPYFKQMYRRSLDLPMHWDMDQEDAVVADILAQAAIAYMPFPDGASGRRGSLLALLANGVVTITTRGGQTPPDMDQAVLFARGPEHALPLISQAFADQSFRDCWSEKARRYAAQFSWDAIAGLHIELYKKLLESGDRLS